MELPTEWVKPNGTRIMINNAEATVEYARSLKWVPFAETPEGIKEAEDFLAAQVERAQATVAAAKTKAPKKKEKAA